MLETDPDLPPIAVASVEYIVVILASSKVEGVHPPAAGGEALGHGRMRFEN